MEMTESLDIQIGPSSADCSVRVNGVDVTSALRGITIECQGNTMTKVKLHVVHPQQQTRVAGAFKSEHIQIVAAAADATDQPIG